MADVFISYSTYNIELAKQLQSVLRDNGITSWIGCDDIPGGTNYTKEIIKAINNCRVFVLILSQNSMKSQYVFKELNQAVKRGKQIIPLILEELTLSDEFDFLISPHQAITAYNDYPSACKKLTSRIQDILNDDSISSSVAAPIKGTEFFQDQRRKKDTIVIKCPYCKSKNLRDSTSVYEYALENPDVGAIIFVLSIYTIALVLTACLAPSISKLFTPVNQQFNGLLSSIYLFLSQKIGNDFATKLILLWCALVVLNVTLSLFISLLKLEIVDFTGILNKSICEKVKQRRYEKGISFWTFRCAKCNHKFRKKILIKEQSNYRLDVYAEPAEEILPIFLALLKAIANKIWNPYNFNKRKEHKL